MYFFYEFLILGEKPYFLLVSQGGIQAIRQVTQYSHWCSICWLNCNCYSKVTTFIFVNWDCHLLFTFVPLVYEKGKIGVLLYTAATWPFFPNLLHLWYVWICLILNHNFQIEHFRLHNCPSPKFTLSSQFRVHPYGMHLSWLACTWDILGLFICLFHSFMIDFTGKLLISIHGSCSVIFN